MFCIVLFYHDTVHEKQHRLHVLMPCRFCFLLELVVQSLLETVLPRFGRTVADIGIWIVLVYYMCCMVSCTEETKCL